MKRFLKIFCLLFFAVPANASLIVELSIENQEVFGSELFFDVYLTRHANSDGDIFLADCDLLLTFNAVNFTNPTFEIVENDIDDTGFCTFVTSSGNPADETTCRTDYTIGSSPTQLDANLLTINIFSPEPLDAITFASHVAHIDGQASKHRLGRFKITGVSNHDGTAGLAWVESGTEHLTRAFSYENFLPWKANEILVQSTNPDDHPLDSLVSSVNEKVLDFGIESIYPNPVQSEVTVTFFSKQSGAYFLRIIAENGAVFSNEKLELAAGQSQIQVPTASLPSGAYSLQLQAEEGVISKKFVKME